MKNLRKIAYIDVKYILLVISRGIMVLSVIFCVLFYISTHFDAHFCSFLVHMGVKKPHPSSEGNITKTMLAAAIPTISFNAPPPKAEPVKAVLEITPPVDTLVLPVVQSDITSVSYTSSEEKGYKSSHGIYINNQTSKTFSIDSLLNEDIDLSLSDEPTVLIIHSHATESYTPSEKYNYIPTDTDRTTDPEYNMVSVGEVIYNHLTSNGINAIHDTTLNDYPSYSKSYSNSLKLVEYYTEKYPTIKIVIDVHRDAIMTSDGKKMRPIADFSPPASQVMLVVGTNDSGLNHPNWQKNLAFATKLQYTMNTLYPSLARPINLRRERFNQHAAPYAFILEVGTNGNTLDEAKEGALLFSKSLVFLLKN